ncbi:hypothetical protein AB3X91_24475 [Paraburkholderia sp. BR14263]|uniref:hypothetical protein n=1 Tax=unclassified Paraburkholderia TaxID=2615204 RepID=UPI0034CDE948
MNVSVVLSSRTCAVTFIVPTFARRHFANTVDRLHDVVEKFSRRGLFLGRAPRKVLRVLFTLRATDRANGVFDVARRGPFGFLIGKRGTVVVHTPHFGIAPEIFRKIDG